LMEPITGPYS